MKTLIQINNNRNRENLELIYLVDWPEIETNGDNKVLVYPDIRLVNCENLFFQKKTFDGWIGLEVEKSKARITPELEKKFLKKQYWKQVKTKSGMEFLLPPTNLFTDTKVANGREITLTEDFVKCGKESCKLDIHGPYFFAHIKNPLGVLCNIYIGSFACFPMLIFKEGKWNRFIRRSNEFKHNK
jgi:hypothetical protein